VPATAPPAAAYGPGAAAHPPPAAGYSKFFVVNQQLNKPDFGLRLTGLDEEERAAVGTALGLPGPLAAGSFLLFRLSRRPPAVFVADGDQWAEHAVADEKALAAALPTVFEIDSTVPLPNSVPIRYLPAGEPDGYAGRTGGRSVLRALREAKTTWFASPAAVQAHSAEITATFGAPDEPDGDLLKQYALARQLLVQIAGIEPETFASLADAIDRGDSCHARGLITQINAELAKNLNFPRYWSQDSDFALVVSHTEEHLHFTISDRTGTEYSFAERSGGLKYFLSYFVQCLAHGRERRDANEVLLMDEPDAFLSSNGQQDLLSVFRDFADRADDTGRRAQIVYVTHSPFLIDKNHSERIRVLDKGLGDEGTRVVTDIGQNHYEPLRSAFGGFVGETTFISNCNLLLEGISDQILLAGLSAHLQRRRTPTSQYMDLNEITLVPAGGASHIPYLAYLARGRGPIRPAVIVLLDGDQAGREARKALRKGGAYRKPLVDDALVLSVDKLHADRFVVARPDGAEELEDLVPPATALDGAKRYVSDALGAEAAARIDDVTVSDVNLTAGTDTHAALAAALKQRLGEDFHLDKVGLARSIVDRLNQGQRSEDHDALEANFRALFGSLNRLKAQADLEALAERVGQRIRRAHDSFLLDRPEGATREEGGLLLDDIERQLGDSPRAEDWRLAVRRVAGTSPSTRSCSSPSTVTTTSSAHSPASSTSRCTRPPRPASRTTPRPASPTATDPTFRAGRSSAAGRTRRPPPSDARSPATVERRLPDSRLASNFHDLDRIADWSIFTMVVMFAAAWACVTAGVVSPVLQGSWSCGPGFCSGWGWQRPQPHVGGDDLVGPWPVGGQFEQRRSSGAHDAGGDVQQPQTQPLGFGVAVRVQPEGRGPGQQVRGQQHGLEPDLVLGEVVQRQVAQAAVFQAADPVFGAGPQPVGDFELGQVIPGAVGGEDGDAPAVDVGQSQLRAGVRPFPARDDAHPGRPAPFGQLGQQRGEFGDLCSVARLAVAVQRRRPGGARQPAQQVPVDPDGHADPGRVLQSQRADVGQERLGAAAAVGAHQHPGADRRGQLRQRQVQHRDVVGGGVGVRASRAQHRRQRLSTAAVAVRAVVDERQQRVEAEGAFERGGGRLLLRVRDHDAAVDVDRHRPIDVHRAAVLPGHRTSVRPGRPELVQRAVDIVGELVDQPADRRVGAT
jgi:hypothetical protein